MTFGLLSGGEHGGYNGIGFANISKIFVMQDHFCSMGQYYLTKYISKGSAASLAGTNKPSISLTSLSNLQRLVAASW